MGDLETENQPITNTENQCKPNTDVKEKIDIEEVLVHIGEFGLFQKLLTCIFCIMSFPVGYQVIIMCLLTLNPSWRCRSNSTICVFDGTHISDDKRRCNMPRSEWEFTEPREFSIVTQFDIYCDREWILHLNSSVLFAGWGIGAFILGWVGDRYGRRIVLFPSLTCILITGFYSTFSPNVFCIIISRFVTGFFIPGTMYCMFLLISELTGSASRPLAGLLIWMTSPVAFSLLALKAYHIRNWRNLSMACTGPYIFVLAFYNFVPDSFIWQIAHKRIDVAMTSINRIAKWNNRSLPSNILVTIPPDSFLLTTHQANPFDVFTLTNTLALKSLRLSFIWLVIAMVYYGVYLSADDLGGTVYRDLFILSISEVPSSLLAIYFCDRFGRKPSTLFPLLVCSLACVLIGVAPPGGHVRHQRIILALLGKFYIAVSFAAIQAWSVEMFPLSVRASGMGFMQIAVCIGSTCAPWIAKGLKDYGEGKVPFLVMGLASFLAFLAGFSLPETRTVERCDENEDVKNGLENGEKKRVE